MRSLDARLKAVRAATDPALLLAALADSSPLVIEAAAKRLHDPGVAGALLAAYQRLHAAAPAGDPVCWGRAALLEALGRLDVPLAEAAARLAIRTVQVEAVGWGLADTATGLRVAAAGVLANRHAAGALFDLALLLWDHVPNCSCAPSEAPFAKAATRAAAARAIGALGDPGGGPLLAVRLAHPEGEVPEVLGECLDALVALEEPRAPDCLRPWLAAADEYLVSVAATNLARCLGPEAVPELLAAVDTVVAPARESVVLALASVRADATQAALRRLAEHADPAVARTARSFLPSV